MYKELTDRIVDTVCVSSFFVLTPLFFGPAHLYFTNNLEYSVSFLKICPLPIAASVGLILLVTALTAPLKPFAHRKAMSLLFAVAVLFWVQGNLLVWKYGLLDGKEIDWSAHRRYGYIDSLLWICLIAASLAWASRVHKFSRRASVAFIAVQLISTLFVAITAPDSSHVRRKTLESERPIFEFSADRNVLILLLDGFQGDIFQEIIDEDASYGKMFDGFIYFRNTLGGYPSTYASIPLILTGQYYDNSLPAATFLKKAYSTNSVPSILKQRGYQVDLIGSRGIFADETIASHWVGLADLVEQKAEMREGALLLDISLFRHLPHFLKRYVYNRQSWLLSSFKWGESGRAFPAGPFDNSIRFIQKMAGRATPSSARSTFKYIHLWPPHPPLKMNERLEYEDLPMSRENFKRQAKGSLQLARMLVEKLKEMGVYRRTMIIILADHGQDEAWAPGFIDQRQMPAAAHRIPVLERMKNSALPLFLVKPFEAQGRDLRVSDAPACLSDIPKTIISELDLQADLPGVSVFGIEDNADRARRFLYHKWDLGFGRNPYFLQPMKEFTVAGFPWLDESWQPTYNLYCAEGVKRIFPETYRFGQPLIFGETGNALPYQGEGWSYPDEGFTPTDEKRATLTLPVSETQFDVELAATLMPFIIPGKLDRQTVKVFVNGKSVGEWDLVQRGLQEHAVVIRHDYLTGDIIEIIFDLPDAASPADLGVGRDERHLAITVSSMVLREIAETP